jgi:ribosomal protein S18 acetylase RimI-like enzyme
VSDPEADLGLSRHRGSPQAQTSVICRQAAGSDTPALVSLLAQLMEAHSVEPPSAERLAEHVRRVLHSVDQVYLVAVAPAPDTRREGAGKSPAVVGMCGLLFSWNPWTADEGCELLDLVVATDSRHRGVATALLRAAADNARIRGCGRLFLLTETWNRVSAGLYRRNGFREKTVRYFEMRL